MRASYLPTILSLHVFSLSCQLPKYFQLQLQNSFYKLQLAKVNNSTRSAGLQFQSTKVVQYDQANYSLIHFYKRCVSGLAWWVAHLWVRSGWVSVFVSHKLFIQNQIKGSRLAWKGFNLGFNLNLWNILDQTNIAWFTSTRGMHNMQISYLIFLKHHKVPKSKQSSPDLRLM